MSKPDWHKETAAIIDRRAFLGKAGLAAGSVAAFALVGAPANGYAAGRAATGDMEPIVDWGLSDVTGACPPYAAAIGYGRPHTGPAVPETGDPLADQLTL